MSSRKLPGITVWIAGMETGEREFDLHVESTEIPDLVAEYMSPIHVYGKVLKRGRKLHVTYTVSTIARLVCDRSVEEYDEQITVNTELNYVLDSDLFFQQKGLELDPDDVRGLRDDAQEIDITDDVRQDLVVALPMKRVAPQFRETELPREYTTPDSGSEIDERWASLQKIQLKK
ncbi:MAG: hypothetical protein D8M52_03080 [Chlorobi bacterium]|nr:MAG: hypothetical protein F9K28_02360 [Bacteroidota bacterium]MBE2265518.1 DUF177 domain-containing protein [Flavobacteriales bacterium]MBL1160686.1 hypothetical protein [Chlorobiota bacterium]MBW7853037.1 DUF177 domain-containing protein [Candidatus Kapabacteria bacterium]MCC6331474.1 DUF177 domain-containing protein [Ignavibacteria bacterium]